MKSEDQAGVIRRVLVFMIVDTYGINCRFYLSFYSSLCLGDYLKKQTQFDSGAIDVNFYSKGYYGVSPFHEVRKNKANLFTPPGTPRSSSICCTFFILCGLCELCG
jgi:hypothetical protein